MNSSRRAFFKNILFGAGALALSNTVLQQAWAERKRGGGAGAALVLVKPGAGMAAGVNYVHNASEVKEAKLKTERQGVKFENQKCANCMLYTKHGELDGKEVGKCTLFANEVVMATGWCTTWAKKA